MVKVGIMNYVNSYGEFIRIRNKNMCISLDGAGTNILVIFPCFNSPSPILEAKALVSFLSRKYKVVTVEGFGNGQSDIPDTERTPENISDEIHDLLQKLNFTYYSVISDIPMELYSLYYVQKYSDEVKAFIMIDMCSSELLFRQKNLIHKIFWIKSRYMFGNLELIKNYIRLSAKRTLLDVKGYAYSDQDINIYALLAVLQLSNKAFVDRVCKFKKNCQLAKDMSITVSVDSMLLISEKTEQLFNKYELSAKNIFFKNIFKKVILKGRGKIHLKYPEQVADEIDKFLLNSIKGL